MYLSKNDPISIRILKVNTIHTSRGAIALKLVSEKESRERHFISNMQ
jgi:hypothetical protein